MAWLAVDQYGSEIISQNKPVRTVFGNWMDYEVDNPNSVIFITEGSIEKLIGRKLTWEDEPVEI